MAKQYSWYEVLNEETGQMEKYPDPLNPDVFPEDKKEEMTVPSSSSAADWEQFENNCYKRKSLTV